MYTMVRYPLTGDLVVTMDVSLCSVMSSIRTQGYWSVAKVTDQETGEVIYPPEEHRRWLKKQTEMATNKK